jgi:hypothetical protein
MATTGARVAAIGLHDHGPSDRVARTLPDRPGLHERRRAPAAERGLALALDRHARCAARANRPAPRP